MKSQLNNTIKEFGENMISVSTPAQSNLFDINDNLPLLDEKHRKLFHKLVYSFIHCIEKERKDLEVAVSFLASRLMKYNEGNYIKL